VGLKLGRLLKKTLGSVVKRAPAIASGFASMGPMGAGLALLAKPAGFQPVGAGVPSIQAVTGVAPFAFGNGEVPPLTGGAQPVAGALPAIIGTMNRITAMAIARLAAALGITFSLATLPRVGMRLWSTIMAFARRHPGVSVIGLLTALGLAADEAAHFLSWGATRKRKRRGRGISARDIRTCRRTMRRMASFQRDMFRARPARRGVGRGGPSTLIAQN